MLNLHYLYIIREQTLHLNIKLLGQRKKKKYFKENMKPTIVYCGLLFACLAHAHPAIKGIGATFPAEVYTIIGPGFEAFREDFVDVDFGYKLLNSIAGKAAMLNGDPDVTFGATESALTPLESSQNPGLITVPVLAG